MDRSGVSTAISAGGDRIMDTVIVQTGIGLFVLFLASHVIVSRFADAQRAIYWLVKLYLYVAIFAVGGWLTGFGGLQWLLIAILIYSLLVVLYIFGVFGVVEASITLRLLAEVAKGGEHGLTPALLARRYNVDRIIHTRLDRFLWSGEIIRKGNTYARSNRASYFIVREAFLRWLRTVFPHP